MGIEEVSTIIGKIADGFEEACAECLDANKGIVLQLVKEQLYSGTDGDGKQLSPTYDNDPYFKEPGWWFERAKDYIAWKNLITPPGTGPLLGLPPRELTVPNLFIDGTFYSEINASRRGNALITDPGHGNGPEIEKKYGDRLLAMGPEAVDYFNEHYLLPAIGVFFEQCGYR